MPFKRAYLNGTQCFYFIDDGLQAEWGVGTVRYGTPPDTLSRDIVVGNTLQDINSPTPPPIPRLNFTSAVDVYNEIPGEQLPYTTGGVMYANARLDPRSGGTPVGSGMDFYGAALPAGWLWANGAAVSRTTYALLFSVISTTFGVGDGSSTFNLPHKGGRASVGRETMGGVANTGVISGVVNGGAGLGNWIGHQNLQSHNHGLNWYDPGHAHGVSDPGHVHGYVLPSINAGGGIAGGSGWTFSYTTPATDRQSANVAIYNATTGITYALGGNGPPTIALAGGGNAQNIQPSLVCNHIIYAGYV